MTESSPPPENQLFAGPSGSMPAMLGALFAAVHGGCFAIFILPAAAFLVVLAAAIGAASGSGIVFAGPHARLCIFALAAA